MDWGRSIDEAIIAAVQSQNVVTAYFSSEQLPLFGFVGLDVDYWVSSAGV